MTSVIGDSAAARGPGTARDTAEDNAGLGWRAGASILLLALVVRGVVLLELSATPFFDFLLGDSLGYHVWAEGIAAGDWLGDRVFYQAPLYPYALGLLYSFTGPSALAAKLAQVGLETVSCVLLADAALRWTGSRRAGLLTGLLAALYAPAIFFTMLVQKASVGFFLTSLVLDLSSRLKQGRSAPALPLALGVCLGLLALTRENALVFIPIIGLWLFIHQRADPATRRATAIACLILGTSLPLVGVGARNLLVGGEFTLTTSQFGPNFYIGNNANAEGFYLPMRLNRGNVKYERDDAVAMAEAATGRALTPLEVSEFWTNQALDYIKNDPLDWLALMARKTALVWNRVEASDSEDIAVYRHYSRLLDALARVFHFGFIVPLAAAGIWLTRRRWREDWPLYALMATYAASLTIFFLFARYRFPLIPFSLIFAAIGLTEIAALVQSRDRRAQWQTAAVVAGAVVVANLPLTDTETQKAATYKNFGVASVQIEKHAQAVGFFARSLEYRPDVRETRLRMGESLAQLGRLAEAQTQFERGLQDAPEDIPLELGLAQVELLQGRHEAGVSRLRRLARLDPEDVRADALLGQHHAGLGEIEQARAAFARVLERQPDHAEAMQMLTRLDRAEALDADIERLEAEVRSRPADLRAKLVLSTAYQDAGRPRDAERLLRGAVALDETRASPRIGLGRLLVAQGRLDEARSAFEEAARLEPANPNPGFQLGLIAENQGQLSRARAHYARALEIAPGHRGARARIARLDAKQSASSDLND